MENAKNIFFFSMILFELVYKKALITEHLKNYVLQDINVILSTCLLVRMFFVGTLLNFVYTIAQKLG